MKKTALITDLDNTLFDWVDLWYHCFSAMLARIVEISGVPEEQLKAEMRTVHQKHGASEYSLLIEELPSLKERFAGQRLMEVFAPAIESYRIERRTHLKLYPGIAETLLAIKGRGARIIGYTESMAFYSNYRLRRLGLDGVLEYVFCPEDHVLPDGLSSEELRKYPASHYELKYTIQHFTPRGSKKPDATVLKAIMEDLKVREEECIYVGDSLFKDVAMAQDAGVDDVWAKYGRAQSRAEYQLLRDVTHWSDADVAREQQIQERDVKPTDTLANSFAELLTQFDFRDAHGR
jgi:FMN phosphatase YigB (HAD superfamily)